MTSNSIARFLRLHDESISRERIRTSLLDWATAVMMPAGLVPAAHHRVLLNNLEQVSEGKIRRLLVLMPPGSAKSTYASVIFPVWWFIQHPGSSVIAASHTAGLVEHFSRRVQRLIEEYSDRIGLSIRGHGGSASHWYTDSDAEYFAVGVRGAVTGRRADLAIIDDPIKSMAEADSSKHRQHIWDWYTAELTPRLKPEGRIVVVMTRWHAQDLGGQLMAQGHEDWRVLRLPAIAEDDDPIGRPPGAPLWPEWESRDALSKKQAIVGERIWAALFQQHPRLSDGHFFRVDRIQFADLQSSPAISAKRTVRAWDLASTPDAGSHDPDWTVGLKLTLQADGRYLIEDIVRIRENYREVQDTIVSTAHADGHSVIISLPIDPGQAASGQIGQLSSRLAGYRVCASREQGSKLARAQLPAAQVESGNFMIRNAVWNQAFLDELEAFPQGSKDDQIDALSRAFITLAEFPRDGRRLFIPFGAR